MHRFVFVMLVFGPALAAADSIEEKHQKADAEYFVKSEIQSMNKKCKTTIPETGVIDWSTWKVIVDEKNNQAGTVCKYVPFGIGFLCNDKIAQESIAKDVKKIVCKGDAADDVTFELTKDGTLVVHTRLGVQNTDKKTKAWLTKNLQ